MTKKSIFLLFFILILLSSFCYAESEWQTSTYASQTGLQIVYPKLDFYNINDKNITFNFNVFNENNTHLENDTTQCIILIYQNNGSRIINSTLLWDNINFYYNWDITNYNSPQNFYYTLFCNQVSGQTIIAKGFSSNNFELNYDGRNPSLNTNYLPIALFLIGICFILITISNNLDPRHGILKLILLSFVVLFFIVFGVVLLTMFRGGALDIHALLFFKTNTWLLRIFFSYVLIFLLIMVFEKLGMLVKVKSFFKVK